MILVKTTRYGVVLLFSCHGWMCLDSNTQLLDPKMMSFKNSHLIWVLELFNEWPQWSSGTRYACLFYISKYRMMGNVVLNSKGCTFFLFRKLLCSGSSFNRCFWDSLLIFSNHFLSYWSGKDWGIWQFTSLVHESFVIWFLLNAYGCRLLGGAKSQLLISSRSPF